MIGHLYVALPNESPRGVGKRMGMPDAMLRDLNYELDLDARFEGERARERGSEKKEGGGGRVR